MRFKLTFEDLTLAEANALMAVTTGQAGSPAGGDPPPRAAPIPAGPPMATPPPGAPAMAPPPAAAPPPVASVPQVPQAPVPAAAPMAAPPAAPGAVTHQAVLAAMQSYARVYKTAGVKAVLQQLGAAKVQDVTDQAQLKWLLDTFTAGLTK